MLPNIQAKTLVVMKQFIPRVTKRNVKELLLYPRRFNARERALPSFIIIGAQRCGTSSLYSYLTQHPNIHVSTYKEVHYFDTNFHRGELWYRAQFPLKRNLKDSDITGEASPSYLYLPEVPERIQALIPDVKLIVLLRDPVARAVSHHSYERKMGRDLASLADALVCEERQNAGQPVTEKTRSYMKRGLYLQQLSRYTSLFPEKNMLILRSEDLFCNAKSLLRQVYDYLGVDPEFLPADLSQKNSAGQDQKLPADVMKKLSEYYREPNNKLYEFLRRDFGWM